MHEATLCLRLLEIAEAQRRRAGAQRITALRLEVGALSGVSSHALARAFPICAADGAAAGASLRIDTAPGRELRLVDMEVV